MTIEEKRAFVSDLTAKLYATGIPGDEAAIFAYAALLTFKEEHDAMTPAQRVAHGVQALARQARGGWTKEEIAMVTERMSRA